MTATFDIATVADSISKLSITGVTLKDIDEVVDFIGMNNAVISPVPTDFITNLRVIRDELSGQKLRVTYTLNYRYYHCKVGAGLGGLFQDYNAMIANLAKIIVAFASDATLTGAVDNGEPTFRRIGAVFDEAGEAFHGCEMVINVTQFLEV